MLSKDQIYKRLREEEVESEWEKGNDDYITNAILTLCGKMDVLVEVLVDIRAVLARK